MFRFLVAVSALTVLSAFPTSVIVSDAVEFNTVTKNAPLSSPVTFGSFFTELPKASVIWTGQQHQKLTASVNYGWVVSINSITQTGATVSLTALIDFTYLKFKYVATQGDRQQVFYLEYTTTGSSGRTSIPFDYPNKVKFDTNNLPRDVFVVLPTAGVQFNFDGSSVQFGLRPMMIFNGGQWTIADGRIPYYILHGPEKTFSDTAFTVSVNMPSSITIQFTLIIHRARLGTETATSGLGKYDRSIAGTITVDTTIQYDNSINAGARQGIMGLIGFNGYDVAEKSTATLCSQSMSFLSPAAVTYAISGYQAAFYLVQCDTSCATCNGVFAHNCLTCAKGIPVSGVCSTPPDPPAPNPTNFPTSVIVSDVIEFNTVTSAAGILSSPVTFGSFFTVLPKASVIWTAQVHQRLTSQVLYGWIVNINSITRTGATVTLKALIDFSILKFKYVATQGDHLQVFFCEYIGTSTMRGYLTEIPFDYPSLVKFDINNLPTKVFVGMQMAGLQILSDDSGLDIALQMMASTGFSQQPFSYEFLRVPGRTFSDTGFSFFQTSNKGFVMQLTLLIHRVNLASETKTSGVKYLQDQMQSPTKTKTFDTSNTDYNTLTVGAGQGIMGLVGTSVFKYQIDATVPVYSQSIEFTNPPANVTVILSALADSNIVKATAVFYVVQCDANCATCNGVFAHNCLTCSNGAPVNGVCPPAGCPAHVRTLPDSTCAPCAAGCKTCTTTFVCLTCELNSYRVTAIDSSNRCPCIPGFYENADLLCVACPPSQYCATCQLSGTSVVCTSCKCSNHREKVVSACVCLSGYREDTLIPGPYCQKNP